MKPHYLPSDGADDDLRQLADVFRQQKLPLPNDGAWQKVFLRIQAAAFHPPRGTWPWLVTAGIFLCLSLGYALWPVRETSEHTTNAKAKTIVEVDESEPFAVASAIEVHILSVGVEDADRLALGQPLLGDFAVASPGDIEIVHVEPHPEDGRKPMMQPNARVSLIVVRDEE